VDIDGDTAGNTDVGCSDGDTGDGDTECDGDGDAGREDDGDAPAHSNGDGDADNIGLSDLADLASTIDCIIFN